MNASSSSGSSHAQAGRLPAKPQAASESGKPSPMNTERHGVPAVSASAAPSAPPRPSASHAGAPTCSAPMNTAQQAAQLSRAGSGQALWNTTVDSASRGSELEREPQAAPVAAVDRDRRRG